MKRFCFFVVSILSIYIGGHTQPIILDLQQCIRLAKDSSQQVASARNVFLAAHWEYYAYRASLLPSLSFKSVPFQYNSTFVSRYDYANDIEVYRNQKTLYMYGSLVATQPIGFTGGNLFLQSDLNYIRNMGASSYSQFSTIPFRIGYSQSLFGFNSYKWEKRIQILEYEKAKKAYSYAMEELTEETVQAFFSLLNAQIAYEFAQEDVLNTDTLYKAGKERARISAISESDLYILELDQLNALNGLEESRLNYRQAQKGLAVLLHTDAEIVADFPLEQEIPNLDISTDFAIRNMKSNCRDYLASKLQIIEAESKLDKVKKEKNFDASLSASIGFNQVAENFSKAYSNPLRQEVASLNLTIPIVDWGLRKGKVKAAVNNLNNTKIASELLEEKLTVRIEQLVQSIKTHQKSLERTRKTYLLASKSYEWINYRFRQGVENVNSLTLSRNRFVNAQKNYVSAWTTFWTDYYQLRKLTLYDFEKHCSLYNETALPTL